MLQACPLFDDQRKDVWPGETDLETKLWGTADNPYRTNLIRDIRRAMYTFDCCQSSVEEEEEEEEEEGKKKDRRQPVPNNLISVGLRAKLTAASRVQKKKKKKKKRRKEEEEEEEEEQEQEQEQEQEEQEEQEKEVRRRRRTRTRNRKELAQARPHSVAGKGFTGTNWAGVF